MDIIRSNYSALGPFARAEAPVAPQYPYTDILAASQVVNTLDENDGNFTSPGRQPLLKNLFEKNLFGEYFKQDNDAKIAHDMASRWVAFAKTGDPNYSANRARWRPWRYIFNEDHFDDDPWQPQDFERIFQWNDVNNSALDMWTSDPEELRQRALQALGMEVVEEDVFQTMLLRSPKPEEDLFQFLFGNSKDGSMRKATQQLQRAVQDMGLLGRGLAANHDGLEDDFFPEMLELKWPPEGRLVERDCTCDMWDRISYRY
jgi:hypothetical protein